jgi:rod shape-determining protein MreB and related proteins
MSFISKIRGIFSAPDIAVDLGTANTRVFAAHTGMVDTPTVININHQISHAATDNYKPTEYNELVKPLAGGVITNVSAAAQFLSQSLQQIKRYDLAPPRVLICAPSDVTSSERSALFQALRKAGASSVTIAPEPSAAAIGAGLEVSSPYAQMIVDIGDGVTDIAVIRGEVLIQTSAVRIAGADLRRAVQKLIQERYRIYLPDNQATMLIHKLATLDNQLPPNSMKVCGINEQRQEISMSIDNREISEAIKPVVNIIVETIERTIKRLPPKIYDEVSESGLTLTGGVAQMSGLVELISAQTDLNVRRAPAPLHSVINGARRMVETARVRKPWSN